MTEEAKATVEDLGQAEDQMERQREVEQEQKPDTTNEEPSVPLEIPEQEEPNNDDSAASAAVKEDGENPSTENKSDAAAEPAPVHKPPLDPRMSIPRKVPQSTTPTSSTTPASPSSAASSLPATNEIASPSRPGYPGTAVGLAASISIPMGVDSKLLQGKLLETLKQLPNNLINDALNEYDDALQNKGGSIRNQGAYLFGVIKRYIHVQERAASGNADHVMGKTLTPLVTERLAKLVQEGFCTEDEMNDKVKSKIRMLSEKDAIFAIDELSSVERGQIRNFSSYFMGILNRYMRGDTSTGGPSRSNRNDDRRKTSRYDKYLSRDRDDRFRGRSPSRDHDYRRRDDDRGRYGGGRDRDFRDRSRDRYDDDRGRGGDFRRSSDSSNSYRDRPRYDDKYAQYGRQPQQQQQQQQPPPQQQQYQQGQYGSVPPPPPPPRQGMPAVNAFAPQQTQQQQQQPMFMAPNQQQLFQQPQQIPQQFVPQQGGTQLVVPGGSSFVPQQQTMLTQQTPQMGQQSLVPNMSQQPMMTNMSQQSASAGNNSFNAPAPSANWQQTQSQTQSIPADILGLADKAASAVQALQASRSSAPVVNSATAPQIQMMPPVMQMQGQPPMQVGQPNNAISSYSNHAPSSQPPPVRRGAGRTTAKLNELPVMVQYAVQNLQATGHVEGTLDEGILGMINELPEQNALQALQRFSSIDTAAMRNKTAYLAGVLRRELEKNQRR